MILIDWIELLFLMFPLIILILIMYLNWMLFNQLELLKKSQGLIIQMDLIILNRNNLIILDKHLIKVSIHLRDNNRSINNLHLFKISIIMYNKLSSYFINQLNNRFSNRRSYLIIINLKINYWLLIIIRINHFMTLESIIDQ
jgi:hypothetical protein